MKLPLLLLFGSLIVGQAVRFPLPGQGGGLLASDLATMFVLLTAYLYWIRRPQRLSQLFLIIGMFIIWSLFTLVIHISDLGRSNFLIAALYWVRLSASLLLLPALRMLFQSPSVRTAGQHMLSATIALLALVGIAQVLVFPNLGDLSRLLPAGAQAKWDPHQGRLVATWLDPNFIGGFFASVLPWILARDQKLGLKMPARSIVSVFLVLAVGAALLLTQSRSSFIALAAGIAVTAPLWLLAGRARPPRVQAATAVVGFSLVLALVVFPLLLFPQRLLGLLTVDDTAALRLESLQQAFTIAQAHPVLGVGYNAYQFAAHRAGFISDFTVHSRAGADNSLLTLAATVGIPGLLLFLLPWTVCTWQLARHAVRGHLASAAATSSLAILFIHSQFLNSLLYSHLLITLIMIVTLAMTNSQTPMSNE